ncbi:MAG TPA: carbohydrate ABC transporter permease [Candidatus Coproplasma stercoravium]|nr:carbohydrate ABC transporter permease [Candidatus Coproplasma stercoravium]
MKRKMEVSELIFKIVAYFFLIVFALMCVYPFLYAIGSAFSSQAANEAGDVILWPVEPQTAAFVYVMTNAQFWIAYANTLFTTIIGTAWSLFYSILGAYALSKKRIMGRHGWNFFLVFTMWFNAGVVATYLNYQATGEVFATLFAGSTNMFEIDLKWLVVIAMGMNATNIILLRNAFEGVPAEIEEAARIDGATEMQVLTKVYLPMSKATIATVALFFGISRWNGYFWAQKVMGTSTSLDGGGQPYSWPVQVYIRDFINKYTSLVTTYDPDTNKIFDDEVVSRNGVVYSMVICSVIPILIIYPFIQKYFAKGVNMGGVKE